MLIHRFFFADRVKQEHVVNRHGDLRRDAAQKIHARRGKPVAGVAPEMQHADDLLLEQQREKKRFRQASVNHGEQMRMRVGGIFHDFRLAEPDHLLQRRPRQRDFAVGQAERDLFRLRGEENADGSRHVAVQQQIHAVKREHQRRRPADGAIHLFNRLAGQQGVIHRVNRFALRLSRFARRHVAEVGENRLLPAIFDNRGVDFHPHQRAVFAPHLPLLKFGRPPLFQALQKLLHETLLVGLLPKILDRHGEQFFFRVAEQPLGLPVAFDNSLRVEIEAENRVAGILEQDAVFFFGFLKLRDFHGGFLLETLDHQRGFGGEADMLGGDAKKCPLVVIRMMMARAEQQRHAMQPTVRPKRQRGQRSHARLKAGAEQGVRVGEMRRRRKFECAEFQRGKAALRTFIQKQTRIAQKQRVVPGRGEKRKAVVARLPKINAVARRVEIVRHPCAERAERGVERRAFLKGFR